MSPEIPLRPIPLRPTALSTRRHRLRTIVAAGTVAAVAFAIATPAAAAVSAAPSAPATTSDPAAAAAGWLDGQFVDGTHFNFPGGAFYWGGLTASGIFGLAAAKVGQSRIDAALGYMKSNVSDDADLTGSFGGPFDGSVATYVLAAIVGGADPTSFGGHNLAQQLKTDQCTKVSAPADQNDTTTPTCPGVGAARNIFSSVSESLAILAESRAGGQYAPDSIAIGYFLSLQCPNGGFTGSTSACSSDSAASVDETAYASMALAALGGHSTALSRANAWLAGQQNPAGYWVVQGGPDVDSTGLATAALDGSGAGVSTARAWLATQQVSTGPTLGSGASRGALKFQGTFNASSSIKATADGLLGLAAHASLATLTSAGATAGAPVLALSAPALASSSVQAGHAQTVTGTGFEAGESVSGVLHSATVSIGSAKASAAGTVTLTFAVPSTLAAGTHTVTLTGATSGLSSNATFTVTTAPASGGSTPPIIGVPGGGPGPVANTGAHILLLTLLGALLIAAGAGAVYAGRRTGERSDA